MRMTSLGIRPHLLAHTLTAFVLLGAAGASAQGLESLTDPEASLVARLDVARLRAAPAYRDIEGVLAETMGDAGVADEHARDVLERVDEAVISARFADLDAEEVLLLARGRFTLDDNARLVATQGVTVETRRNHRVMRRGQKAAVFVGTDRFVFGNAPLVLAALDRIDGAARRAPVRNAALATLLAAPSRAGHMLSLAAVVEGEVRALVAAELSGAALGDLRALAIDADLTSQLSFEMALALPDTAASTSAGALITSLISEAARMPVTRTMGLVQVVRATRARVAESRVLVTGRYRDADVRRVVRILAAELGPDPETQTEVRTAPARTGPARGR